MICEAILKINPNAKVTVRGSNIDTCKIEWLDNTTPISIEDIKAMIPTVEQEEANRETKKASGKQKLKDLGLDDDEIKALMGA
jgi:hypothetical protein|tara:strand:- start:566 stop:814 length:249 start_codon:yes stop_codon:yes gene_type:complete